MASITDVKLTISHDHRKKTAAPKVTCKVNFNTLELCMMKNCTKGRFYKLKCQLWGDDPFSDDFLFTYSTVFYFPDGNPTATESRSFSVVLGEGVLDEDWLGKDEIYGKVILQNLFSGTVISKKSNVVSHSF